MSGFDSLLLAENVANFPLPIITGIGHDRDECVLDLISFLKVKTPTAAAAFLTDNLLRVKHRVDEARDVIVSSVSLQMERQSARLQRLASSVTMSAGMFRVKETGKLDKMQMALDRALHQALVNERHRVAMLLQRVQALDPMLLLKRGFSMTMLDGKLVRDAAMLQSGQEIETILEKGRVKSVVK